MLPGETVMVSRGTAAGRKPPAGRNGTFDGRNDCRKCFCVLLTKVTKEELATILLELLMFEKVQMICRIRHLFTDKEEILIEKNNIRHERKRLIIA